MEPEPSHKSAGLDAFIEQYFDDEASGRIRPLKEYLSLHPGIEDEVAREYLSLRGPSGDGAPTGGMSHPAGTEPAPLRQDARSGSAGGGMLRSFLRRFQDDLRQGRANDLPYYEALYPRYRSLIAQEYHRLLAAEPTPVRPLTATEAGQRLGPYQILHEIGRGGQGLVYLAQDTRLHRRVALKVLTAIGGGSEEVLRRFRREAEVASKLDHHGICAVYDAGIDRGIAYIAMRHVEGETLAARLATAKRAALADSTSVVDLPTSPAEPQLTTVTEPAAAPAGPSTRAEILRILSLIERLALALHAAHEAGIIHRDIKPGNIMITPEGDPVILDFGLARESESVLQTLTRTGDVFGTPAYMSPEQLAAQRIRLDRRTDVYSVGVTLYECLTLRRPFEAPTREALYQAILTKEPPDPRRLNPNLSPDLRVVLEKALEKDRDRRYETAAALAEDLRRIRVYEPILARPAGRMLRTRRWVQRNPVLATASAALFLLLATGLGISIVLLRQVESERDEKDLALGRSERERLAKDAALIEKQGALQAAQAERDAKDRALTGAEGLRLLAEAAATLQENPGRSLLLAIEAALRHPGLEADNTLHAVLDVLNEERTITLPYGHAGIAVFAPDGQSILTAAGAYGTWPQQPFDHRARTWDAATGKPLATLKGHRGDVVGAEFSADAGRILTVSRDRSARIWDAQNGQVLAILGSQAQPIDRAAMSSDGRRVVSASDGCRDAIVWDAGTGRIHRVLTGEDQTLSSVSVNGTGTRVLTVSVAGAVTLWDDDRAGNASVVSLPSVPGGNAVLSPGGRRMLSFSEAGAVRIWDADTGAEVGSRPGPGVRITEAVLSGDGQWLAALTETGTAQTWDLAGSGGPAPGAESNWPGISVANARGAALSPDGRYVLIRDGGRSLRLLDRAGREVQVFKGHEGRVLSASFSRDGNRVVSSALDGTVRTWRVRPSSSIRPPLSPDLAARASWTRMSPDGRRQVVGLKDGTARLIDTERDEVLASFPANVLDAQSATLSPDGERLAAVIGGDLRIFDAGSGDTVAVLKGRGTGPTLFGFSPDSGCLAAGSGTDVTILDGRTGRQIQTLVGHGRFVRSLSFSRDGRLAATASSDTTVRVWDTASARELARLGPLANGPSQVLLSPDGERLVTVSEDLSYQLRDWRGNRELFADSPRPPVSGTSPPRFLQNTSPRFDATGRRLLSPGRATADSGKMKLIDSATGTVLTVLKHAQAVFDLEGTRVLCWATGFWPDSAEVMDASSGTRLGSLDHHGSSIELAAFGRDASMAATITGSGRLQIWDLQTYQTTHEEAVEGQAMGLVFDPVVDRFLVWDSQKLKALSASRDPTVQASAPELGLPVAQQTSESQQARTLACNGGRIQVNCFEWTLDSHFGFSAPSISLHSVTVHDLRRGGSEWSAQAFEEYDPPVFSSDGRYLLATSPHAGSVNLWDTRGERVAAIEGESVPRCVFSPDGDLVLSAGASSDQIWSTSTGECLVTLRDRFPGQRDRPEPENATLNRRSNMVAISTVHSTTRRGITSLWQLTDGVHISNTDGAFVPGMPFSPDRELLVVRREEEGLGLVGISNGRWVGALRGHDGAVHGSAFTPAGDLLATGGHDGTVRIWNPLHQKEVRVLRGHADAVRWVAFSPDGRRIVSHAPGETIRLWEAATGALQAAIKSPGDAAVEVCFSVDGRRIVSGADPAFHSGRSWPVEPLPEAIARRPRELSAREILAHRIRVPDAIAGRAESLVDQVLLGDPSQAEAKVLLIASGPGDELLATAAFRGLEGRREHGAEERAARMVERLFADLSLPEAVADAVLNDDAIDDRVLSAALRFVEQRPVERAEAVDGSWGEICRGAGGPDSWRATMQRVGAWEAARRRRPAWWTDTHLLATLVGYHYRAGAHAESLDLWETLLRAFETGASRISGFTRVGPSGSGGFPDAVIQRLIREDAPAEVLGFAAMSQERLGRRQEARRTLAVLIRIMHARETASVRAGVRSEDLVGQILDGPLRDAWVLVRGTFEKLVLPTAVVKHLENAPPPDQEVREIALELARAFPPPSPRDLELEARRIVSRPGLASDLYRSALTKIEAACSLESDRIQNLLTLGMARYRAEDFVGALEAFLRTASLDRTGRITCLDLAENGEVCFGSGDGVLWAWRPGGSVRKVYAGPSGIRAVACVPRKGEVLIADARGSVAAVDRGSGAVLRQLPTHGSEVDAVAVSGDGALAASGDQTGTIHVSEVASGRRIKTLDAHEGVVSCLDFGPDGRSLASASWDGSIAAWNLDHAEKPVLVSRPAPGAVSAVSWTRDGRNLVSGGLSREVVVSDATTGDSLFSFPGHDGRVSSVRPVGADRVATGSLDGTVRVWNIRTRVCEHHLRGHNDEVWDVAVSPDGRRLVSAGRDDRILSWSLESGLKDGEAARPVDPALLPPAQLAFYAMSQHRLGRTAEAASLLRVLKTRVKESPAPATEEALGFLKEAEALIGP